jgi:hypothetical protein
LLLDEESEEEVTEDSAETEKKDSNTDVTATEILTDDQFNSIYGLREL